MQEAISIGAGIGAGFDAQLGCRRDGSRFRHCMPCDVDWLTRHWRGTFKVLCPQCGAEHEYVTKEAYMQAVMSRERPLADIVSSRPD